MRYHKSKFSIIIIIFGGNVVGVRGGGWINDIKIIKIHLKWIFETNSTRFQNIIINVSVGVASKASLPEPQMDRYL